MTFVTSGMSLTGSRHLAVQGTLKSLIQHPMNSMKRQKDSTLRDELPKSVGVQYATENHWRNNSRKNEGMIQENGIETCIFIIYEMNRQSRFNA